MKLPFELPYTCADPACGCNDSDPPGTGMYVKVRTRSGEAHEASVIEDGIVKDVFHDHDISALLASVHREYPGAESHTPFKGKVARSSWGNGGA